MKIGTIIKYEEKNHYIYENTEKNTMNRKKKKLYYEFENDHKVQ